MRRIKARRVCSFLMYIAITGVGLSDVVEMKLPQDSQIRRDAGRGTVTYLRAKNLSASLESDDSFRELQATNRFAEIALAFLTSHRRFFGLEHPADELVVQSATTDDLGLKHLRLQQVFQSIPVWGAELVVHLDRSNHVYLVQGHYIRTPSTLRTTPGIGRDEALRRVARELPAAGRDCRGCQAEPVVFVTRNNEPRLAYHVLVSVGLSEGWSFVVDAETASVLEKVPTVLKGGSAF